MKITKNINARYNINTGMWAIRNNGMIIAQGQGINTYGKAYADIEKTTTKKIVERFIY